MPAFSIAAAVKQLALLGVACGTTGTVVYKNPEMVRKAIHRIIPTKPVAKHTVRQAADHINAKTVPACPVGILPISGISLIGQPAVPMDWDDGDAPHEAGSSFTTGSRSYELTRPPFIGSVGGHPGSPGGGGTVVVVKPTPKPTETPVAAVPEPGTWMIFLVGFTAIGWTIRAQKRAVRRGSVNA